MRRVLMLTLGIMVMLLIVGAHPAPEQDFTASVRVIHLSPNAENVSVELHPMLEGMEPVVQDEWSNLQYLDRTDFSEVGSTQVEVLVTVDGMTVRETVTFEPQMYYTITITGVMVPEDMEQRAEEDDEGFFAWLQDLVTSDDETERYQFQVRIHQDELDPMDANDKRFRLVHASPGTDSVSLAYAGEEDPVISGIDFGEESSYVTTDQTGELELRIAGSSISIQDMLADAEIDFTEGRIYTVYLAGMAFQPDNEETGIHVEVIADEPDPMEGVRRSTAPIAGEDGRAQAEDFIASVRIINLSPNAESVSVELHPTSEHMDRITYEEWNELQYLDRTEFFDVESAQMDVLVTVDGITIQERVNMDPRMHYTITLTGLVVPEELEQRAEEDDEGFWGWVRDLFTGDDPADEYRFQVRIHQDEFHPLNADEMRIRLVHASPGTAGVDVGFAGDDDTVISGISYGEESSYTTTDQAGELELRIAGSSISMQDVLTDADQEFTPGMIYTVYLAGMAFSTDAEEAGVHVEVFADSPDLRDRFREGTYFDDPMTGEPRVQDGDYTASVRVIQLSPNAENVSVELHPTAEYLEPITHEEWTELQYLDRTDFYDVESAQVEAHVTVNGITIQETFTMEPGRHYTIALTGLVVPEDLEQRAEENDEGFWGWVQNLFTDDASTDEYRFQVRVYQDELRPLDENELRIRVVHASPGTDAVDLAFAGEDDTLTSGTSYGEQSSYATTDQAGELELRIAGSVISMQDMLADADIEFTAGRIYTVYLAGTAFQTDTDEAGIHVEVVADEPDERERVPGTTPVGEPIAGEPRAWDEDSTASVRVIHLAPNAEHVSVGLAPTSGDMEPLTVDEWSELQYLDRTDFQEVASTEVDVHVTVDGMTVQETVTLNPNMYYTIALTGVVVPEDMEQRAEEDDEGFFGWLEDLLTGEDQQDRYQFQVRIYEDDLATLDENDMRIRVVHASPGTDSVSLAFAGEEDSLVSGIRYGEASSYVTTDQTGELEMRIGGSSISMQDMLADADTEFTAGRIYTVYLAGTAFQSDTDEAGIRAEVVADEPDERERAREAAPADESNGVATQDRDDDSEDRDDDFTFVRVIQLSPNAENVSVELHPTSENREPMIQEEWNELQYLDRTDFQQVRSTEVEVHVKVDGMTIQETVTLDPQIYYTIALTGVVVPEDMEQRAEENEEGFFGWLEDLLTGDEQGDQYQFQVRIYEDDLAALDENEMRIRVVHASPGTDSVSLAFAGEEDPLISGIGYGEDSAYVTTDQTGELQLRIGGSSIPMQDMLADAEVDIAAGQIYTVYLAGMAFQTDSDEAGIQVTVVADGPDPMESVRETAALGEPSVEEPQARDEDFIASVRVIHLSPNAGSVSVELQPTSEDRDSITSEEWNELQYLDRTEFHEVSSMEVEVQVTVGGMTIQETVTLEPYMHYTIALAGVVVPEDMEQRADEDDEGFFEWLQDLVTGDEQTNRYQFQVRIYQDELTALDENEMRIRLVHVSPGTDSVSLAFAGEDDSLISGIGYGEDSAYVTTDQTGELELRIAGLSIPMQDMLGDADTEFTAGRIYTVYLAGAAFQSDGDQTGVQVKVVADAPDPMEGVRETTPSDEPSAEEQPIAEEPQPRDEDYTASVRIIQLSPNAERVSVELQPTSEDRDRITQEAWSELQYLDRTDFYHVESAQVEVHVTVEGITIQETFTMDPRKHYTIALTGLVVPEELEQRADDNDGGFWGWIRDLFTGDEPTDEYRFQVRVYEDDLSSLNENEMRIRVVHASPGTEDVDLAFAGEDDTLISGVGYGEDSSYVTTDQVGELELRIAGSSISMQDMLADADIEFTQGQIYTVYLAGTAFQSETDDEGVHVEVIADGPDPMEGDNL